VPERISEFDAAVSRRLNTERIFSEEQMLVAEMGARRAYQRIGFKILGDYWINYY
jgi:hypothetical protein